MMPADAAAPDMPPANMPVAEALTVAVDAYHAGRFATAERHCRHALDIDPDHPEALHLLGLLHEPLNLFEEAVTLIARAAQLAPSRAVFHESHGRILGRLERHGDAVAALERAVALAPEDADAWRALGDAAAKIAGWRRSAEAYARALECADEEARRSYDAAEASGLLHRGNDLKAAVAAHFNRAGERVNGEQGEVPTFADMHLLNLFDALEILPADAPWEAGAAVAAGPAGDWLRRELLRLRLRLFRAGQGRLVAPADRPAILAADPGNLVLDPLGGSELSAETHNLSQGEGACLRWRGRPIFKSVYDLAILTMMIGDIKPATVFEIGSGTGASAVWLADQAAMQDIDCAVLSVDRIKPELDHRGVTFIEGDCTAIADALPGTLLAARPHPWLVIEDAHVAVPQVLGHFAAHMRAGDYFMVEDSATKQDDLAAFHAAHEGTFRIDTGYTDFFGRNATSAVDSILVRV